MSDLGTTPPAASPLPLTIPPPRSRQFFEAQATEYRTRLRSAHRPTSPVSPDNPNDEEEDEGIEAEELEQLIAANETRQTSQVDSGQILTIPARDPVTIPEWGDELTKRYVQEQLNSRAMEDTVAGLSPNYQVNEPPSGAPGYFMIPATLEQFLAVHDEMILSQGGSHRETYPEPAFNIDITQYMLTSACPWLDRNLHRMSARLGLKREILHPATLGTHFLIGLMRPDIKTKWRQRKPNPTVFPVHHLVDTPELWATLDEDVPPRREPSSQTLPEPNSDNVLPCELSSDVDSIILLCDQLPISLNLDIPSMPSWDETIKYSNKLCLPAGPRRTRTLLSKIPNFRLGRAGRLSVNMFFPDAFDPTFAGMGSSEINPDIMEMLWDLVIQPAILGVFPRGAHNSLPQSGQYESDRQSEIGGRSRPSWRSTSLASGQLSQFVVLIRQRLDACTEPTLQTYRSFKFLISLQGFKSFSFTRFDDLNQSEMRWAQDEGFCPTEIKPAMMLKGYLKGLRKATADHLVADWLDFNDTLQQGVARIRRLTQWNTQADEDASFEVEDMEGDDQDLLVHPNRRRAGPSLQLVPDMSRVCVGGDCHTCGVWVDVAVEIGCAGKVTVWNHSHCFDAINSLIGRNNFDKASEWRAGVRLDEVATMPGLGGAAFIDRRAPTHGSNPPEPYVQLYCQEKVPTYAPWGNKARGAQDLDVMPARRLPMKHLLDCSADLDGPREKWIAAEGRILDEPRKDPHGSFPARMEVRAGLNNLLETIHNILVAVSRATKTEKEANTEKQALRHYDKDDWFRWKKLRAECIVRLPGIIIGKRQARPSDWMIIHVLLACQGFMHGLHSRIPDITIERDTVNMHCMYLQLGANIAGQTYRYVDRAISLRERALGDEFRPFFPAGFRTLHEFFDSMTGLSYSQFERRMQGMSNAQEKWELKVRRGVGCTAASGMEKLRTMVTYPSVQTQAAPSSAPSQIAGTTRPLDRNSATPTVFIQQDSSYIHLETIVNQKMALLSEGTLVIRKKQNRELEVYSEGHEILDVPYVILQFGRSLGLLEHAEEALRLHHLQKAQEEDGCVLELGPDGKVEIQIPDGPTPLVNGSQSVLSAGGLDVYNFQRNTPGTALRTEHAIRSLDIRWEVAYESRLGLSLPGLSLPQILFDVPLPSATTSDDIADDALFHDWLHRIEDSRLHYARVPSINDYVVFVFSSFQQQLLTSIPKTIRANNHFPEHEGLPYIKSMLETELSVTQNLLRDSYVGLPARLTRFVATQVSAQRWESYSSMFFPRTVEEWEAHPGWVESHLTYLDTWAGLLERVGLLPNAIELQGQLQVASKNFIESHKILPHLTGKTYNYFRNKGPHHGPVPIWDDAAFEKQKNASIDGFTPRWMTINHGDRVCSRLRLVYTMTAPAQQRYLGKWQDDIVIKEKKHNYAVLFPSPAPFEYPWMKQNHHTIISERGYMIWKEQVKADRFNPPSKEPGIGHNWWDSSHSTITCPVCRTWNLLNPPALDDGNPSILDVQKYNLGGRCWGYFACRASLDAATLQRWVN
ncbi:hypothetical protein QFC22_004273 [Naganishia vaughanmartiniae]|uniref:Uncharacterized protein n=2 Tax=Naganishia vaughanmartiniae TaxID=1424756 RepID=A0ACC2X131_9TREE|nr:hypothetical protein QFC22_004273 [Naganishia vaughanmartiniae]